MEDGRQRTGHGLRRQTRPEVALMTVGETASATGVTVRTLHHYDEIGLVSAAARSSVGYRLYAPADPERLQQVVAYRRLGLGLEDIAAALAGEGPAEGPGRRRALERQRELVEERITELTRLLAALDAALENDMKDMKDIDLSETEMRELFGDSYTEHFEEYQAEAMRVHMDHWFFPIDGDFHRNRGDMYVQDPRFAKTYEAQRPGLSQYLRDAIHANAVRLAGEFSDSAGSFPCQRRGTPSAPRWGMIVTDHFRLPVPAQSTVMEGRASVRPKADPSTSLPPERR